MIVRVRPFSLQSNVLDAVICVVTELAAIGAGTRLVSAKVGEEKECPNSRAKTRNSLITIS